MEFTQPVTGIGFLVLVGLGLVAALATPMNTRTVVMMVLPALVVYGLLALILGVKHGEYRARQ
ncbi:MAG: hypothetical protein R3324_10710 [Halobacteriales archaeon]|nr:hypothetical protein [Halobacteriales archaeon]